MDTLMLGFSVIRAGNGEAPAGLWPPQAGKSKSINMVAATAAARNEQNLPMHPLVAHGRIRRASRQSSIIGSNQSIDWNGKLV
jgi:hypothetical protein